MAILSELSSESSPLDYLFLRNIVELVAPAHPCPLNYTALKILMRQVPVIHPRDLQQTFKDQPELLQRLHIERDIFKLLQELGLDEDLFPLISLSLPDGKTHDIAFLSWSTGINAVFFYYTGGDFQLNNFQIYSSQFSSSEEMATVTIVYWADDEIENENVDHQLTFQFSLTSIKGGKLNKTGTLRSLFKEEVAGILKIKTFTQQNKRVLAIGKSIRDLEINFDDQGGTQESQMSHLSDHGEKFMTSFYRFPIFPVCLTRTEYYIIKRLDKSKK